MLNGLRDVARGVLDDFRRTWRSLALTDLAYKLIAFAVLTPATALFLRWLLSRTHTQVLTDADIALFFVNTPPGLIALILGGSIILTISLLEVTCLMGIGFAGKEGARMGMARALTFGAAKAQAVLRLAFHMLWRLIAALLPFTLVLGAIYWFLLHGHDINYYLARRPPEFWAAAALAGAVLAALAALAVWAVCRWVFALPLVLFEGVSPRKALPESAGRSVGHRRAIGLALAAWAAGGLLLACIPAGVVRLLGRALAPHCARSVALLLALMAGLVLLWGILTLASGILTSSAFALVLNRLYHRLGDPRSPVAPAVKVEGREVRLGKWGAVAVLALGAVAASGTALLVFMITRHDRPVAVIAHRGASLDAPENTLAAFREAIAQKTDVVELDVQESSDGEVMVVHDSDLMKVAGSPLKIWESTAAQLRAVDLGSRVGPQFAGERVPTLAEALATCKGRAKMIIELKSYGHDQHLEEKVVALVEAAGMQDDCTTMSLDHEMVRRIKALRPQWRSGVLVAKALGDLTTIKADFLAVEARVANARFVRRAHRAGQEVYVWTVDTPAWMLTTMTYGVDGLITNKPALARKVIARREQMSDAQRLVAALMIRWGARVEDLAKEDALRP